MHSNTFTEDESLVPRKLQEKLINPPMLSLVRSQSTYKLETTPLIIRLAVFFISNTQVDQTRQFIVEQGHLMALSTRTTPHIKKDSR